MCVNHCFEKTLHYNSPGHGGWGIIRVAALIPESHLLFICPSACFRHGSLGAVQHGYKDKTSYLYITPSDVITGYDAVIEQGVEELMENDPGIKVLFLFAACIDDFIGTDMDAIAKQMSEKYSGLVVRTCHMNPIAADTSKPPLVTVYQSMLSTIPVTDREKENAVNLLGKFVPIPEECEMHEFFAFHGIERVRQIANYERFEAFCEMGTSKYNLVISPSARFTADYMDKTYHTVSAFSVISYDLEEIRKNYEQIEESLFPDVAEKFDVTQIEEKAKEAIGRALEKVKDIPIVVSDSAVMRPFSLAKALLSYGFQVKEVVAQTAISVDKEAYETLLEAYPDVKIIQPLHHQAAVREKAGEGMVAIGFEGAYLRQCDYVVDLSDDEGMYGYYGVMKLMEMLEKSVEEKADLRSMIEEYGAVV